MEWACGYQFYIVFNLTKFQSIKSLSSQLRGSLDAEVVLRGFK